MVILSACSLVAIIVSTCILVNVIYSKDREMNDIRLHCDTCGASFSPVKDTTYQINCSDGIYITPEIHDATDCPVCGRQIIMGRRYRKA